MTTIKDAVIGSLSINDDTIRCSDWFLDINGETKRCSDWFLDINGDNKRSSENYD